MLQKQYTHVASICFQVFQVFAMNVLNISSRWCKSRSGCCIYMHVASVCCKCFRCFNICCKCFIWMLHMFFNGYTRVFQVFSGVMAPTALTGIMPPTASWPMQAAAATRRRAARTWLLFTGTIVQFSFFLFVCVWMETNK